MSYDTAVRATMLNGGMPCHTIALPLTLQPQARQVFNNRARCYDYYHYYYYYYYYYYYDYY
eukprot:14007204-Heterocapsa_arctica.AAC.1